MQDYKDGSGLNVHQILFRDRRSRNQSFYSGGILRFF